MTDPYAVLGLARGASLDEAKTAFRRLAKTCHPDTHPNDPQAEARFKDLNAAYEAIKNPQPEQPQGNWSNFSFNFGGASPFGGNPFEDIFAQINRSRQDMTFETVLTLEEAFAGKEVAIQLPYPLPQQNAREIKVRVPSGVDDGMRLMVKGAGQPLGNGRAGDLYLVIRVLPHNRFTRQGVHLITTVPVTAFDILLGREVEVVGIDGQTMRVAIPQNFDSTRKLRLAGQGMPDSRSTRGDLLIDLFVQYPQVPSKHLEALATIAKDSLPH